MSRCRFVLRQLRGPRYRAHLRIGPEDPDGETSATLFETKSGTPSVIALAGAEPPEHVVDRVQRDVRAFERNRRRISTEIDPVVGTPLTKRSLAANTVIEPEPHNYRTVILSVDDEHVVAAAAVLETNHSAPLHPDLVRGLARVLSSADEVTATETVVEMGQERAGQAFER